MSDRPHDLEAEAEGRPRPDEGRLDELRREAAETGRVAASGARVEGGPIPPGAEPPAAAPGAVESGAVEGGAVEGGSAGYYGLPVLKEPVWTWEVPLYFFVGGLAGMSGVLALAAALGGGGADLVGAALWIAVAGAAVSAVLLILDLGRPKRFLHMLRVFKWRSPMSVGVWVLTTYAGVVTLAAVLATWGPEPLEAGAGLLGWVLTLCLVGSAVLGSVVATYTGVLIGATAIPAWSSHRALLPIHFGLAGLGSAAALLELLGFAPEPLHLLGYLAAGGETAVGAWVELRRRGVRDRVLHRGRSGWLLRTSGALAGPVSLALRLLGWRYAAAGAFLLGALVSRYGWLEAGRASARDPEAALTR